MTADATNHTGADTVRLTLPASARHASTARVVAASIAADLGFDVDEIDDLRLGLNEAVAVLADGGRGDDELQIEFSMSARRLDVEIRRVGGAVTPVPDDLADRILSAVVDHHEYAEGVIRMSKSSPDVT